MTATPVRRAGRALGAVAMALLAGATFVGCVGIDVPTPVTEPVPAEDPGPPQDTPTRAVPTWYGKNFDSDGCPTPNDTGTLVRYRDVEELLGVGVASDWCAYRNTSYTGYYVIPAVADETFSESVRERLAPEGWEFEADDGETPQWSWVTKYPESAGKLGFRDGTVNGAIFTTAALSVDDTARYRLWFVPLMESFDEWRAGDPAYILGFW